MGHRNWFIKSLGYGFTNAGFIRMYILYRHSFNIMCELKQYINRAKNQNESSWHRNKTAILYRFLSVKTSVSYFITASSTSQNNRGNVECVHTTNILFWGDLLSYIWGTTDLTRVTENQTDRVLIFCWPHSGRTQKRSINNAVTRSLTSYQYHFRYSKSYDQNTGALSNNT